MLFNKAFTLPVALLAGASFAFAQQGGAVPQPSKATLAKADPILKSARTDLVKDQISLTQIIHVKEPAVPDINEATRYLNGILNILTNVETNLTAPADVVPSNNPTTGIVTLPAPDQKAESVILSECINSLVASARLVLSLNGNPLSQTLDLVTAKMLDVLKLCSDKLRVAFRLTIRAHLADKDALDNLTPGFKAISTYLKGNVYPQIP